MHRGFGVADLLCLVTFWNRTRRKSISGGAAYAASSKIATKFNLASVPILARCVTKK